MEKGCINLMKIQFKVHFYLLLIYIPVTRLIF